MVVAIFDLCTDITLLRHVFLLEFLNLCTEKWASRRNNNQESPEVVVMDWKKIGEAAKIPAAAIIVIT